MSIHHHIPQYRYEFKISNSEFYTLESILANDMSTAWLVISEMAARRTQMAVRKIELIRYARVDVTVHRKKKKPDPDAQQT